MVLYNEPLLLESSGSLLFAVTKLLVSVLPPTPPSGKTSIQLSSCHRSRNIPTCDTPNWMGDVASLSPPSTIDYLSLPAGFSSPKPKIEQLNLSFRLSKNVVFSLLCNRQGFIQSEIANTSFENIFVIIELFWHI